MLRRRSLLHLSEEQVKRLQAVESSQDEPCSSVVRARILLRYARGEKIGMIAREEKVSRPTVHLCIDKALAVGIEGAIRDLSRSGRPCVLTGRDKAWVRELARSKPAVHGYATERWTIRELAGHVRKHASETGHRSLKNSGTSTVMRVLKESSPKQHGVAPCVEKSSRDVEEMRAQILTVCREIELLRQTHGKEHPDSTIADIHHDGRSDTHWVANITAAPPHGVISNPFRQPDCEHNHLGTVSLLAGIDLHDGRVMALVRDQHRSREFIEFLAMINASYPVDWRIRIVLATQTPLISRETMKWLKDYPNHFEFIFTPKHGSWLNLVDVFFSKMTRSFLKSLRVESKSELIEYLYGYIEDVNRFPAVFRSDFELDEPVV